MADAPKPLEKYRLEAVGSSLPTADGPKVSWPSLRASQIRHPLDSQATLAIQRLFPFDGIARISMGGLVEQLMTLDNLSNGIKVSENQLPAIHKR